VATAIFGRCPSELLRGSRVSASAVEVHAAMSGSCTSRRHLPACTTSFTPPPVGTLSSVKRPCGSVFACTSGLPLGVVSQRSHEAPVGTALSAALGM
jgi:hypothetical protein